MMIDIHSHDTQLFPNLKKVLSIQLHPETDILSLSNALPPELLLSVGVHPWHASEWTSANMHKLLAMLQSSQITFIGEIGLDNVCGIPLSEQMNVFEIQLQVADIKGIAVLIHNVGHQSELLALKKKYKNIPAWIIHGFRGKATTAQQYLSSGFYLSFGFVHQREAIQICPIERLFLESDEAKAELAQLYEKVAQEKGLTFQELECNINRNFISLFGKEKGPHYCSPFCD
jgi:TatD DNase family protein